MCTSLPGCGVPGNITYLYTVPGIATLLLNISAALALIFMIIGGFILATGFGEQDKVTKGKNTMLAAAGGLVVALTSAKIVGIVASENFGTAAPDFLFGGILPASVRIMLNVFNVTCFLMILAGGMRYIYARGKEDELKKARNMVVYALIGAVIVNLSQILVKIVLNLQLV